jgi:serine protease AprX
MAIPIPSPLVEFILLGPSDDQRQLQDSPILGDVWVEFGKNPADALDLLIAPYKTEHAGTVAAAIDVGLEDDDDRANIAYLQGLVVARLSFEQVLEVVVPKTKWWIDKWVKVDRSMAQETKGKPKSRGHKVSEQKTDASPVHEIMSYDSDRLNFVLRTVISWARDWYSKSGHRGWHELRPLDRFVALAGLILWAGTHNRPTRKKPPEAAVDQIKYVLHHANAEKISTRLSGLAKKMLSHLENKPLIWQVSLNRTAMPALTKSVPAVKADAAKTLFKVNCSEIAWAVIDSGIDGDHPAFGKEDGTGSRIKRSFDFKNFRKIVSLSNSKEMIRKANVKLLMQDKDLLVHPPSDPDADLKRLADDARSRGPIHWELVEKFVEIKPTTKPSTNHGTHVAGIIGANKAAAKAAATTGQENEDFADGMCPDISLYDFRVLGPGIKDTEFAIIAALQFIRYLNDRDNFFTIHGANLSLSIPHDVRNFACGRTPICNECERLVESGIVVITAAGNHGYKSFETKEGSYESYAAFSITDPGNADSVVTVGATHRFWPHTYGVSFFSSRGPTGDGRIKPDLVAPGERIRAPFPGGNRARGGDWGDLDGTSMAAPHVSGAAAMLIARYSELIGHPRRIKQILCDSATDLGRERSFQGHGMLDVLRAFQSI